MIMKKEWITDENGITEEAISWAEEQGKILRNKNMTSSQLRKFFGEMRRIQSSFDRHKEDIPFMKAKLAYSVAKESNKQKKEAIKQFYKNLEPGIEAINGNRKNFNRFVKICEALIAYHKFHGGE